MSDPRRVCICCASSANSNLAAIDYEDIDFFDTVVEGKMNRNNIPVQLPMATETGIICAEHGIQAMKQFQENTLRAKHVLLPASVNPIKYTISLTPDLKNFTFAGEEDIEVEVFEEVSTIQIHAMDIQVDHAELVSSATGERQVASEISYDKAQQIAVFKFDTPIRRTTQNKHDVLKLKFRGELNDKLVGFYRSQYTAQNGEKKVIAVTQFEPTDARRAFPCWDEPSRKAIFSITLVVPNHMEAISNMPIISEQPSSSDPELKVVKYADTPIMSTYLVAFIIGEFDFVEAKSRDGINVRVYTPVGKKQQGNFALNVSVKTIDFFTDFFNIGYPLPKMDLLAIPDFAAGAMENWGAITYRETRLLIDEEQSSASTKQETARTVAHEIGHQWFGNLTTMQWWTHLWLNEGFARFVEHLAVNYIFPEWDIWTQFVQRFYGAALSLDGLETSHPIEVEVNHPDEINEIFDTISYAKGASVIRMLAEYIGEEKLKEGLYQYLSKHKYSNATTEDLWDALARASKKPIGTIMNTWTKQMGYPVLFVSVDESHSTGETIALKIKQHRFLSSGIKEDDTTQWRVPVSIKVKGGETKTILLTEKEELVTIPRGPTSENAWIKLNYGQAGFYRVLYSDSMLHDLQYAILNLEIPASDRLCIISDAFAFANAKLMPTSKVLKLLESYKNETDYSVWSEISANIGFLSSILGGEAPADSPDLQVHSSEEDSELYARFRRYVQRLFSGIMDRLGWDKKPDKEEGHLDVLFRTLIIGRLGSAGHQPTIDEAKKRFATYLKDRKSLHPDLRFAVYRMVISTGGNDEWEQVLQLFREADMAEEKQRALQALGFAKSKDLLQKTLDLSLSSEVRSQDLTYPLSALSINPRSRRLTWEFVKSNWDLINSRYGSSNFMITGVVGAVTSRFITEEMLRDVEQFFETHQGPTRKVKQSLETVRSHVKFLKREKANIAEFLKDY